MAYSNYFKIIITSTFVSNEKVCFYFFRLNIFLTNAILNEQLFRVITISIITTYNYFTTNNLKI